MKKQISFLSIIFLFLLTSVSAQTVYITNTGSKYHREYCRYLSRSSNAISLSKAIAEGYTPCKVCSPPITVTTKKVVKSQVTTNKKNQYIPGTVSVQCSATTKAGKRCKRMTKSPNGLCWQHGGN